jgi:DUF1365 family protein
VVTSALYVGRVRHRRSDGPRHRFTYPVWYAHLDLDELPGLARRTLGLSHNRCNLVGFDDRDHMGPERRPVRAKLARWFVGQGLEPPGGRVTLLTHLRLLGHVFNPVSFFFCHDPAGQLRWVVAEVNNTFGETYCYLLDASATAEGGTVRDEAPKVFHVSPFQPVTGRYRFHVRPPAERVTAHIEVERSGRLVFDATLHARRRPLTAGSLLRTVARHPHTGLRTLGLIHLQALRLWLKRAPFHPRPEPPPAAWRTRHG